MAKTVEVVIGGQSFTLRRNIATLKAVQRINESKAGSMDLSTMTAFMHAVLRGKDGSRINLSVEDLEEMMDTDELQSVAAKFMSLWQDENADSRSLAPFVPTPEPLIERMLDVAELKAGEGFLDPACGDGRTLVAAEKRAARVVGYEINEERYALAAAAVSASGLVIKNDGADADVRGYDVIFLYLLPASNEKIKPKLLSECKDTCRIVSHAFPFEGWQAYHTETVDGRTFYAYRISDVRAASQAAA